MPKLFNISSSNNFVETLSAKLIDDCQGNELSLADILILLPNRRACRSLADAFVRQKGMEPTLLPQMRAIGDVKEDELILSGAQACQKFLALPPAIDPLERTMLFMQLIMGRYQEFGIEKISLAQACHLAQELGNLLDMAALQNLDWAKLSDLVPDEYAIHWQETLKFLKIITAYWPDILSERGVIDASIKKNILIESQSQIWQDNPPNRRIIIAGTTAVSPAMKNLVKTVINLPQGEVYLAGLDTLLEDAAWEKIDETHPQFEFKQLLDFLQISRHDVTPLVPPVNAKREKFISEIMRPAASSDTWLKLKGCLDNEAVSGLKLLECDDTKTEALSIAIIIRKILETPAKTAALITPDRNLARRVSSELRRWNIDIDDSAGIPLAQTPWGIFMRLSLAAVCPDSGREHILALLKNDLLACGQSRSSVSELVNRLDKDVWRSQNSDEEVDAFIKHLRLLASDMITLLSQPQADLKSLITAHILLAESFAATDILPGQQILWQNEDGQAGASFLADWLDKADSLKNIDTSEYPQLFEAMMSGLMVPSRQKTHPRIRILGPIEARLNHFDTIILGGFNEGTWPQSISSDPWMSRPMKKEFGFELPERQIGVMGLDFSNLLGAKEVYITRAKMSNGTPTSKSRWLMRLETVIKACDIDFDLLADDDILTFAALLDQPASFIKISAPAPHPPVSARPRKMSASAFEKLLRDPYSVFAEYILKLKPLNPLTPVAEASDFGNIVHHVLEEFGNTYPDTFPANAKQILLELGTQAFAASGFAEEKQAFWRPKYAKMVDWIVSCEQSYRHDIAKIHNEVWGEIVFNDLPGGKFTIYAKADRLDETKDGKLNIIDYKTGQARTAKEVMGGYAPQLPIEGIIATAGGFTNIQPKPLNSLMYWKLGDEVICIDDNLDNLLQQTTEHIKTVINLFDFASTGYLSRPNPKSVPEYSDYEHLSRVREWSVKEEGNNE